MPGQQLGALLAPFDHLDLVAFFEALGDSQADVAATGDHDALDWRGHPPQLAHDRADVLGRGEQEHLVAGLDNGIACREHRLVAAENCGDAGVGLKRKVQAHVLDRLADEQAALIGPDRDETDSSVGEIQHLQGFGKLDQAPDVIRNHLLRAQRIVDREIVGRQQAGIF